MKFSRRIFLTASLIISLLGLIIIYFFALNLQPEKISISDITSDMEGRKISTTGYIVDKNYNQNGHLFLTISDGKNEIQVPLFADLMKNLENIGITNADFHKNEKISVEGTLEVYRGSLQIVPKKVSDVKFIGK